MPEEDLPTSLPIVMKSNQPLSPEVHIPEVTPKVYTPKVYTPKIYTPKIYTPKVLLPPSKDLLTPWFVVDGNPNPSQIFISPYMDVFHLKQEIKIKMANGLRGVASSSLELWQVRIFDRCKHHT